MRLPFLKRIDNRQQKEQSRGKDQEAERIKEALMELCKNRRD